MTSPNTYDQLDHAITLMLTEPETALPTFDADAGELLELAAELRSLPRPEFQAALENDLRYALGLPLREAPQPALALLPREVEPEAAMPTLFGGGPATYPVRRQNFAFSLGAHAAAIALIIFSGFALVQHTGELHRGTVVVVGPRISEYVMPVGKDKASGGGGGGEKDKLNASGGRLPQQSLQQITPPTAVIRNPNPALAELPTVVVDPSIHIPQPNVTQMGDPLADLNAPPSNGTGSGGGRCGGARPRGGGGAGEGGGD